METEIIGQLFLASFLGALIGLEREYRQKGAGLKTYTLVTLGSCLFTLIALKLGHLFYKESDLTYDVTRVIQAIATGIGFICGGVIFRQGESVAGLTTAAALWVSAAIGIAVGSKFYFEAIFTAFLTIIVLFLFRFLEEKILRRK